MLWRASVFLGVRCNGLLARERGNTMPGQVKRAKKTKPRKGPQQSNVLFDEAAGGLHPRIPPCVMRLEVDTLLSSKPSIALLGRPATPGRAACPAGTLLRPAANKEDLQS